LGLFWLGLVFVQYRAGSSVDGVWVFADEAWAFDLAAYINAAQRLIDEGSLYLQAQVDATYVPGGEGYYHYAPPLGVAMLPFTGLSLADASVVWWAMHVGALSLAVALMPVSPLIRAIAFAVVAFSLPALKDTVLGNVSLLLLLPLAMAWRWIDRPIGSLVMALAISVRPSLGLFFLWQLLRGRWRAAAWTAAGGVVLVALTLPFVGLQGYEEYVAVLGNLSLPAAEATENRDLGALLHSLGMGQTGSMLGRVVSIIVAATALLLSLRRDRDVGYMVVLCGSMLVVPLLWDHYLATLVLPAALLAQRLWRPLILLPLLSWLPIAAPIVVIATMLLTLLVQKEQPGPVPEPAGPPA
jgi:hypothetical protein